MKKKPSHLVCGCDCHKALYNDGKCECQPEVYKEEKGGLQIKPDPEKANQDIMKSTMLGKLFEEHGQTLEKPMSGNQPEDKFCECMCHHDKPLRCFDALCHHQTHVKECQHCYSSCNQPASTESWDWEEELRKAAYNRPQSDSEAISVHHHIVSVIRSLLQEERLKWEAERMEWLKRILPKKMSKLESVQGAYIEFGNGERQG